MQIERFNSLIDDIIKNRISDLHFWTGEYPYIRNHVGDMSPVVAFGKVTETDMITIISYCIPKPFTEHTIDTSYERNRTRFRVNISRVINGGITIAMRMIPSIIPEPESIGLPKHLLDLTIAEKGIVLITGPTGSGKSTTMAAMLEHINRNTQKHIITLEDPVEFIYENKKSLIHQRELGKQYESFPDGIRSILREDPDVIVVGEMRDLDTIRAAVTLAETGHLVFSTLHTNDTVQTVDRIIQSFPPDEQAQIRMQFSLALKAIVSQVLLPKADGTGLVVAREVMLNNDSIRNLIIRWETHHMYSILEISKQDGMILMDDAIIDLYKRKYVTRSVIEKYLHDKARLAMLTE